MSLVGNLQRRRKLREQFEIDWILGFKEVPIARSMREMQRDNLMRVDTRPAPKWNLKLGLNEWAWVLRFMFEQRVINLMR